MPSDDFDEEEIDQELKDQNKVSISLEFNDETTSIIAKPNTEFKKVFNAWMKSKGLDMSSRAVEFLTSEGKRIQAEQTPKQLEWMPGQTRPIDVRVSQVGG